MSAAPSASPAASSETTRTPRGEDLDMGGVHQPDARQRLQDAADVRERLGGEALEVGTLARLEVDERDLVAA